jgi:hypothetical protein
VATLLSTIALRQASFVEEVAELSFLASVILLGYLFGSAVDGRWFGLLYRTTPSDNDSACAAFALTTVDGAATVLASGHIDRRTARSLISFPFNPTGGVWQHDIIMRWLSSLGRPINALRILLPPTTATPSTGDSTTPAVNLMPWFRFMPGSDRAITPTPADLAAYFLARGLGFPDEADLLNVDHRERLRQLDPPVELDEWVEQHAPTLRAVIRSESALLDGQHWSGHRWGLILVALMERCTCFLLLQVCMKPLNARVMDSSREDWLQGVATALLHLIANATAARGEDYERVASILRRSPLSDYDYACLAQAFWRRPSNASYATAVMCKRLEIMALDQIKDLTRLRDRRRWVEERRQAYADNEEEAVPTPPRPSFPYEQASMGALMMGYESISAGSDHDEAVLPHAAGVAQDWLSRIAELYTSQLSPAYRDENDRGEFVPVVLGRDPSVMASEPGGYWSVPTTHRRGAVEGTLPLLRLIYPLSETQTESANEIAKLLAKRRVAKKWVTPEWFLAWSLYDMAESRKPTSSTSSSYGSLFFDEEDGDMRAPDWDREEPADDSTDDGQSDLASLASALGTASQSFVPRTIRDLSGPLKVIAERSLASDARYQELLNDAASEPSRRTLVKGLREPPSDLASQYRLYEHPIVRTMLFALRNGEGEIVERLQQVLIDDDDARHSTPVRRLLWHLRGRGKMPMYSASSTSSFEFSQREWRTNLDLDRPFYPHLQDQLLAMAIEGVWLRLSNRGKRLVNRSIVDIARQDDFPFAHLGALLHRCTPGYWTLMTAIRTHDDRLVEFCLERMGSLDYVDEWTYFPIWDGVYRKGPVDFMAARFTHTLYDYALLQHLYLSYAMRYPQLFSPSSSPNTSSSTSSSSSEVNDSLLAERLNCARRIVSLVIRAYETTARADEIASLSERAAKKETTTTMMMMAVEPI